RDRRLEREGLGVLGEQHDVGVDLGVKRLRRDLGDVDRPRWEPTENVAIDVGPDRGHEPRSVEVRPGVLAKVEGLGRRAVVVAEQDHGHRRGLGALGRLIVEVGLLILLLALTAALLVSLLLALTLALLLLLVLLLLTLALAAA